MNQVGDEKLARPLFWSKVLLFSVLAHVAIVIGLIYEPLLYQNVSFLNDLVQRFGDWTEWSYLGVSYRFQEAMRSAPIVCIFFVLVYTLSFFSNFDLYIMRWKRGDKNSFLWRIGASSFLMAGVLIPIIAMDGRDPGTLEDPNFLNSGLYGLIPSWLPTFLLEIIGYSLLCGYTFGFILFVFISYNPNREL